MPDLTATPNGTSVADRVHIRGVLPVYEGWKVSEHHCDDGVAYIIPRDPTGRPWMIERTAEGFAITPPRHHSVTGEVMLADEPLPGRWLTARGAAGAIRRSLRLCRRRGTDNAA